MGLPMFENAGTLIHVSREVRRIVKNGAITAQSDCISERASLKDHYRVLKCRVKALGSRSLHRAKGKTKSWTSALRRVGRRKQDLQRPPLSLEPSTSQEVATTTQKKKAAGKRSTNRCVATGAVVGGVAGCLAGAKMGARFGTMVGGKVGSFIGAGLGTVLGGVFGVIIGAVVGGWLSFWLP
ncbi:hypothetical protein GQ53DRAFT_840742 [Thozetella sp. PMI_491]|nr:hypothetical protein GQ53DRAFT_840742 [Thozetella sp. PMI_491]